MHFILTHPRLFSALRNNDIKAALVLRQLIVICVIWCVVTGTISETKQYRVFPSCAIKYPMTSAISETKQRTFDRKEAPIKALWSLRNTLTFLQWECCSACWYAVLIFLKLCVIQLKLYTHVLFPFLFILNGIFHIFESNTGSTKTSRKSHSKIT